jgi:hypothetical protein
MQLNWTRCQGDVWYKLNFVNLDHEHFNNRHGVYVIWHGGTDPAVVYVGQGDIKERLAEHQKKPEIQQYKHLDLYVTWATVPKEYRDGVESYLADTWSPKVGVNHPQIVRRIKVNSPWE